MASTVARDLSWTGFFRGETARRTTASRASNPSNTKPVESSQSCPARGEPPGIGIDLLSAAPSASGSLSLLTIYSLRIAPGVALFAVLLAVLPKESVPLRITVYMMLFFLMRDAMTPVGLWVIPHDGSLTLSSDPFVLSALGTSIGLFVLFVHRTEPALRALVVWRRGSLAAGLAAGVVGAVFVAAPAVAVSHVMHPAAPPPPVGGVRCWRCSSSSR